MAQGVRHTVHGERGDTKLGTEPEEKGIPRTKNILLP